VLKAIRENEPRAISLGYRVDRYKLAAFVLSATLAGLAGGTKAIVFQLASLTDVHWTMSGEVVLMTLLGGMGTVFGRSSARRHRDHAELPRRLRRLGHGHPGARSSSICVLLFREGIVGRS
jgi:branched-chain amino acid transport system permease protein